MGLLIFTLAILIAGCGGNPGTKPVVKVGDWSMDVDLFRKVIEKKYGDKASELTIADLTKDLNDVLDQRLVTLESYKAGIDTLEYSVELYDRGMKDRILDALYTKEVIDKVISEDEMRDFYKRDTDEVRAQHILVKVDESRSDEDAQRLINHVYRKAVEGDSSFTQLALEYNEDETTPDGHIDWFDWGTMVDPFQQATFNLKVGEISKPVKTVFGWHIIKLLDKRKKKARPSYESAKNDIRERIMAGRVDELNARRSDYLNSLLNKYQVELDDDNILEMLRLIDEDAPGKLRSNPLAHFNDQQKSMVLATLNIEPKEFRVAHLENYLLVNVRPTQRTLEKRSIKRLISQIIAQEHLLPAEAEEENLYDDPEVKEAATNAREYYQFSYYKNMRADAMGEPSDSVMLEYYNSHLDRYRVPAKYEGTEVLVDNHAKMSRVERRFKAGESLEKLAREFTIRANGKENSGHIGPYPASIYGPAGEALEGAKVGDLVGPMKLTGSFALLKVTNVIPSHVPEFEKVRAQVASHVKAELAQKDFVAWTDSLRQEYDYKLYPQNLKYLFTE